jgi:hypothetical protein
MKVLQSLAFLFLFVSCASLPVYADTIATDPSENGGAVFFTTGVMIGWTFEANTDVMVTRIGYFDVNGDGLAESHEVGIWDLGGALMGSVFVSTTDPLTDGFRYALSPAISLIAGHSYVIGGFESGGNDAIWLSGLSQFAMAPELSYGEQKTMYAASFSRPDTTATTFIGGNFGPNFEFSTVPVPEPTVPFLIGLATLRFAVRRRRR